MKVDDMNVESVKVDDMNVESVSAVGVMLGRGFRLSNAIGAEFLIDK